MDREHTRTEHDLQSLRARCDEILASFADKQNAAKQTVRRELLSKHPELRIRPDTAQLRLIIAYDDFRCSPYSSVARDEAIPGSDIDGGVIITREKVFAKQQEAFVEELRRQGFSAYTQEEVEIARREASREFEGWEGTFEDMPEESKEVLLKAAKMDDQQVIFISLDELNCLIHKDKLEDPLVTCLAGASIK